MTIKLKPVRNSLPETHCARKRDLLVYPRRDAEQIPGVYPQRAGLGREQHRQPAEKVDDHTLQLHWTADVSPSVALNILSTPIASIVDEKQVVANVKDNDFGNAWLKMHSAGSGAFKMRVYQPHQAIVLEANESAPGERRSLKASSLKTFPIRLPAAC